MTGVGNLLFGTGPIHWLQQTIGPGHPLPFRVFSLLGDTWGILLVLGLALWVFGRRSFHALVGIVVAGAVTKVLLATVVHQERPSGPEVVVYEHLEVSSFPSGHVYAAVAPWALLWVLGHVRLWVPALIAVLVSLGRLYLGTHYVGDVLAGVALAALLVWGYAKAWPGARRWLGERGWGFFLALAAGVVGGTLAWMAVTGGNPRRFEVFGMMLAASLGLPLEHRFVRWRPPEGAGSAAARVALGTAGIAAFLLWDRSRPDDALYLGLWTAGIATLWTVLGAPALFRLLGLAGGTERRAR